MDGRGGGGGGKKAWRNGGRSRGAARLGQIFSVRVPVTVRNNTIQLYCQVSIQFHKECFMVPGTLITHLFTTIIKHHLITTINKHPGKNSFINKYMRNPPDAKLIIYIKK